jgi:AcrR family transcriptional regulator
MSESAEPLRARQRRDTERRLIHLARTMTAQHGINGFTIDQLCESAGLSRRTFFNYFASKDDAVIGLPMQRAGAAAAARFLAGGDGMANGPAPDILRDLVDLTVARWDALDITAQTASELIAALRREPRLFQRMTEISVERERFDARLVEQREDLPIGDLRAAAAAQIMGSMTRAATEEFLQSERPDSFRAILERRLAAAGELFGLRR